MSKSKPVEPVVPVFTKEELPSKWDLVPIAKICLPVEKVNPKEMPDSEFDYIDISGIDNKLFRIAETKRYAGQQAPSRARQLVRAGDIVFSTVRTYLKNIALVRPEYDQQIASTGFCVLRPAEPEFSKYLYYYVQYEPFLNQLARFQRGTSYPAVRDGDVTAQLIPVPPKDEARRIVAEIEKQFSRLDEAVANLKRVKANLKRYKAAVLKAAVEGKLTEDWRKQHPDVEPASELLKRILAERRAKWNGKGKYREPTASDTTNLPGLPKGWMWATPERLSLVADNAICAGPFGTIFKAKDFRAVGVPIIFLRHIAPGQYLTQKPGFMDRQKWNDLFREYSVFGGELLITKLGDPPGVCTIYPEGIGPAMVTPDVIKMTVNRAGALPKFLMHYLNSEFARRFSTGVAFGTTRLRLTIPIFREMPVPLPPLSEQELIVAEVEQRFSVVEQLQAAEEANFQRANRLRQAILQRSFSGKLFDHSENVA